MGKPFVMATDGPNTFSCSGLMRYIMRTIGVDGDAPWVPEGYLSKYAPVTSGNLQPGDIVIYPGWATMYVGNGMLLNSNESLGYVTQTPMSDAGVPLGIVRPPYGGQSQGGAAQPLNDTTTQLPAQPLNDMTQLPVQPPSDPTQLPAQPLNDTTQLPVQPPSDPLAQPLAGATQYEAPQPLVGATQYAPM